eukprot:2981918-Amphidinium_carterae.2
MHDMNGRDRSNQKKWSQQEVMQKHGTHWQNMSESNRNKYVKQADLLRAARAHDIEEAVQDKITQINYKVHQAERAGDDAGTGSATMTYAVSRLSPEALMEYATVHDTLRELKQKEVNERAKGPQVPEPLTSKRFEMLRSRTMFYKHALLALSDVAKYIVRSREHFQNAVFLLRMSDDEECRLKMCFALQKPLLLCTSIVRAVTEEELREDGIYAEMSRAEKACLHDVIAFQAMPGTDFGHYWDADIPYESIHVYMNCQYDRQGRICTLEPAVRIEAVMDSFSAPKGGGKHDGAKKTYAAAKRGAGSDAAEQPRGWVSDILDEPVDVDGLPGTDDADEIGEYANDIGEEEAPREIEVVAHAVKEAKRSLPAFHLDYSSHFRVSVLGGDWQMKRTGRSIYGVRVDGKSKGIISDLLACWPNLPHSASYDYNMAYIATQWQGADFADTNFPAMDSEMVYPAEHMATVEQLGKRAQNRLKQIRTMWPYKGPGKGSRPSVVSCAQIKEY